MMINEGGQVTACTIVQSSGSTLLGEATCEVMPTKAKFLSYGKPGFYQDNIAWRLNG